MDTVRERIREREAQKKITQDVLMTSSPAYKGEEVMNHRNLSGDHTLTALTCGSIAKMIAPSPPKMR